MHKDIDCRAGPHLIGSLCSQYRTSLLIHVVQTQTSCLALTQAIPHVPDPAFPWNTPSLIFPNQA